MIDPHQQMHRAHINSQEPRSWFVEGKIALFIERLVPRYDCVSAPLGLYLFTSICCVETRKNKYHTQYTSEVWKLSFQKRKGTIVLSALDSFCKAMMGNAGSQNINSTGDRKSHLRNTFSFPKRDGNICRPLNKGIVRMSRLVTKPALWMNLSVFLQSI